MSAGPTPRPASRTVSEGSCPACNRHTRLSFHHLIPRKVHRRTFFRKHFSRAQLSLGIYLCRMCHDGIHDQFDETTLAKSYSDPAKLLSEPSLIRHFSWVARQRQA
ncbi:hypothetical protein EYC98_06220 [Halieaceae bacterium IMCC14734]|uniref:HNH domain-containing protein n=1 Tax=Candidatus Litorirhabdus singularis TaxID=2518993 RepID=A0ABT3TDT4_9GAMM|nr:hypothetical protein [Candidatus Litorirhabdus singularis]